MQGCAIVRGEWNPQGLQPHFRLCVMSELKLRPLKEKEWRNDQ